MQLYLRARIVPINQRLPWRDAHNAAKNKGGLPPHVLLDYLVCNEAYRQTLPAGQREQIDRSFPIWSGDGYAHPAKGETFQPGQDIASAHSNWRLTWADLVKHVSPGDITQPKTGLFIRIKDVHDDTVAGQPVTIVQPASVVLIHPAVEGYGSEGKVHGPTGMVLEVSPEELRKLPEDQTRRLLRREAMIIGPLVRRVVVGFNVRGRGVDAGDGRDYAFGVASVAYDLLDDPWHVLLEGITLADVRRFAAGETPDALKALSREQLDAALALAKQPGMTF